MKQLYYYYLLLSTLTLFACNHPATVQHPADTSAVLPAQKNTKLGEAEKHQPVVMLYEKGDSNILFMEDSTRLGKLGFYCYTDLSVVEKKGTPAWIKDLAKIPMDAPLLMLNDHPVTLSRDISDLSLLMPTYIQTFEMQQEQYLMISLNLISFSGGGGWAHILLKVDATGKVIGDKYFETSEMMNAGDLKNADLR